MNDSIPCLLLGFSGVMSISLQLDFPQPNRISKIFSALNVICKLGLKVNCNLYTINHLPVALDSSCQDSSFRKSLACTVQGIEI